MLKLLWKEKNKSLEEIAVSIQNGDEAALRELLSQYKPFVKKTVSTVCKHYIDDSDDEFSIGLIAFHEAIMKYDENRGSSLLAFAEVIIKRKVIDYIRSNSKYKEISMQLVTNESETNGTLQSIEDNLSIEKFHIKKDDEKRKEEIIRFGELLKTFKLSFNDLIKQSPKHEDARINAFKAAIEIVNDRELLEQLMENKKLPMKLLEKKVDVSRKTLERNRKYIIAVVLILAGDFLYLKEYIKGRLEG
ncbi:RNA polymerase subunit sigma [Heyndrickxia shackletonii]|uniref:RNA polymerase sigma factor SigI n=1 Tax=Heyndrickxia shackletonii TaxID=157838 RepID=A0A0Q3WZI1_9BACI|nr:RNA polymerase sigma-I factor [Heyndrickxia shackletonii]KQL54852.1 RNA polymerase subunit sigma [Heyndrickxia shackletonii]NEY99498.1 RNA polymerase sigma-I factor [Heyndrickxia shackletonii]